MAYKPIVIPVSFKTTDLDDIAINVRSVDLIYNKISNLSKIL